MKIKYLGTAAAEGVPALGCVCPVCAKARKLGGRNIRSRSQAIVNDELLIDFGPDTFWHTNAFGLDLNKIEHCLITHSHPDHLYQDEIDNFRPHFCHGKNGAMNFYAAVDGYNKIKEISERGGMDGAVAPHLIEAGIRFEACGYSVMPMWANHDPSTSPVIYSIEKDGKRLLYAHDTGVFPERTWELLKKQGRYDLVSLDCTGCLGSQRNYRDGHMSLITDLEMVARMKELKLVDEKTVLVAHHFSHNGGQCYDDMAEQAAKEGFIVSYDGLELEF